MSETDFLVCGVCVWWINCGFLLCLSLWLWGVGGWLPLAAVGLALNGQFRWPASRAHGPAQGRMRRELRLVKSATYTTVVLS